MNEIYKDGIKNTIWLQERLFKLSKDTIHQVQNDILSSEYPKSNIGVINLAHNIVIATESRCLTLPYYVDLVTFLIREKEVFPSLSLLIPEITAFCFKHSGINSVKKDFQPFLVLNFYMYNQFYFLYLLYKKIGKEEFKSLENYFCDIYLKHNQRIPSDVIQMFLPEIEKNDPDFYYLLKQKREYSMLNIKTINEIRDNFFCNSFILKILMNDDVDNLQRISISQSVTTKIELYRYFPFRFRDDAYPINISAFFGSIKCFKFLFINFAQQILFDNIILKDAIIGGNIEIVRLIAQQLDINNINEDVVKWAIAAHQNDIVQWLIDNNNSYQFPNFVEICLDTNNVEILEIILDALTETEKLNIFKIKRNRDELANCAAYSFFDVVKYLFEYEHLNNWKDNQIAFMNVIEKVAETNGVDIINYLIQNSQDCFYSKPVMNSLSLLIGAAKSGSEEMFNYALKLFKEQKKKPKSSKIILGKAVKGGNINIFKTCLKLFPNDITTMYKDKLSLLSLSIINNHQEIFEYILTLPGIDINQGLRGTTPLYYASLHRRESMVLSLLKFNDSVDINSKYPIMYIIKYSMYSALAEIVKFENVDPNIVTGDGTPLLLAIDKKDITSFRLVLTMKNIDINMAPLNMNPPIVEAIMTCQNNTVFQDTLFEQSALDINNVTYNYCNLLHVAVSAGNPKAIFELNKRGIPLSNIICSPDICQDAIEAICQCNGFRPNCFSEGYLSKFIKKGYYEIVKFCLTFDECDVNRDDPIIEAMNNGNEEIAVLIAKRNDFKPSDNVLMNAIQLEFENLIEILLNCPSYVFDACYRKGKPIYLAVEKGSRKVIKLLLEKSKDTLNIMGILSTKISPEKDQLIRDLLVEIGKDITQREESRGFISEC